LSFKNEKTIFGRRKGKGIEEKKTSSQSMMFEKQFLKEQWVAQEQGLKRIDGQLQPLRAKERKREGSSIKRPLPLHDARGH